MTRLRTGLDQGRHGHDRRVHAANPGRGEAGGRTKTEPTQPTEERTQNCPSCGDEVTMVPYDIGSGPEMSCPQCEWCWGADGQDLKPIDAEPNLRQIRRRTGRD